MTVTVLANLGMSTQLAAFGDRKSVV